LLIEEGSALKELWVGGGYFSFLLVFLSVVKPGKASK
jgi:hypothetical protein